MKTYEITYAKKDAYGKEIIRTIKDLEEEEAKLARENIERVSGFRLIDFKTKDRERELERLIPYYNNSTESLESNVKTITEMIQLILTMPGDHISGTDADKIVKQLVEMRRVINIHIEERNKQ